MFKKNVPLWERWLRAGISLALVAGGLVWGLAQDWLTGGLLIASGLGLLVSAVSGYCPACAAVGRKLPAGGTKIAVKTW